jgi:hypothetical protein
MMNRPISSTSSRDAINAGIAAGNINISGGEQEVLDFSESSKAEQQKHALALQQAEAQRRARSVVVPTNDADVRKMLRGIGQPICYFGGQYSISLPVLCACVYTPSLSFLVFFCYQLVQLFVKGLATFYYNSLYFNPQNAYSIILQRVRVTGEID